MKTISTFFFILFCTSFVKSNVNYTDPKSDAQYVSINNTIVIGTGNTLSESILSGTTFTVTGSKSGIHSGNIVLSFDHSKLIFKPNHPFAFDENVNVKIESYSSQISFDGSQVINFSFRTEKAKVKWGVEETLRSELGENYRPPFQTDNTSPPELTVTISNNPTPGQILLASIAGVSSFLMISENSGVLDHSQEVSNGCYDFKKHPDGTYTYFTSEHLGIESSSKFLQLDSNFSVIDSFYCRNGYVTDLHDIILMPSGNAILMSYDAQIVNMSQVVPGGDTNALVEGLIIQEVDPSGNVVFQWRSWDHFNITDAEHLDLTMHSIDYVHGNAIELDTDGNLLLSSRHMSEITKINRSTGDIIWRLGGKNNQFQFTNDTLRFTYQHDVRRISNGNITMFDNGNYHTPSFTRVVEYQLDEINKKATLAWQYRHSPDLYSFAMGSARRLSNGNTIIGWGFNNTTLTEVTPNGVTALEMKLPTSIVSYRIFKVEENGITNVTTSPGTPDSYVLSQNYPNPFNPSTTISFSLPIAGNVTVKVYDVMGREIQTLVKEHRQAGSYIVNFDASSLSSGVYIYKIETDNFSASKKMVLMK